LQGPPGVGKTHLAIALGVRAVENGFSVAFYRIEDLLHAMRRDAHIPPQRLRGKKYLKVPLLILDEIGFQPLTRDDANLFFRLVSYRYQRGAMILTTNKSVKDWPEILAGDEVMATAVLDRLLHKSRCSTSAADRTGCGIWRRRSSKRATGRGEERARPALPRKEDPEGARSWRDQLRPPQGRLVRLGVF
jgi:DNA replication protein DnaC